MPDEGITLRDINWRTAFPFTNLFRGFRVAVHPSKLFLALLAIAFLWCGGLILDAIWPAKYKVTATDEAPPGFVYEDPYLRNNALLRPYDLGQTPRPPERRLGVFETFFEYEVQQANNVLMFDWGRGPFESIWRFIAVGPGWLWTQHWVFALL